jgi:hypothetical protein
VPTDEELLRARLGLMLGQVTAGPAPVASVLRKGWLMRIGYRVSVGAAVVVACAAVAAAMTGLSDLHNSHSAPAAPKRHHQVRWPVQRVLRLADRARDGVIAEGTSKGFGWDGRWRIWIDTRTGKVYDGLVGSRRWTVGSLAKSDHVGGIATFHGANIEAWPGVYAVVAPDVTRIVAALNSGQKLTLYPVRAASHRWVGLLLPLGVYVTTETAYSGRTELGHMVTFSGEPVSWLSPGQSGPAVRSGPVGTGFVPFHSRIRWSATVQAGPWGYCLSLRGFQTIGLDADCITFADARVPGVKAEAWSYPKGRARWLVGTAGPAVAYLKLDVADGTTIEVPAVAVDGQRFYALAIVTGQVVVRWGAYDRAGTRLYGGSGEPHVER